MLLNEFEKEHMLLKAAKEKCFIMHERYGDLKVKAKCIICPIGKAEIYLPMDQKHLQCNNNRACKAVVNGYKKLIKAEKDQAAVRELYSKRIFNFCCDKQPELLLCQTGETVQWNDAFGQEFDDTTLAQRNSLVALVEEDGGKYRLKEITK